MVSPNVELIQSLFSAWERGDYTDVDWAHPEIEFSVIDGPAPTTRTGIAGMIEVYREVMNAWEGYHGVPQGYRVLADGRVFVALLLGGRGRVSGVDLGETQPNGAAIFEVRGHKVTKVQLYWDRERALADVGLSPQEIPVDIPDPSGSPERLHPKAAPD